MNSIQVLHIFEYNVHILLNLKVVIKRLMETNKEYETVQNTVHWKIHATDQMILSLYSTAKQNTWRWGVGVGQCTRRQNFALPKAKYTNMLVYFA